MVRRSLLPCTGGDHVLRALAARPGIFASMIAMHTGALSPSNFARSALLPLGWRIIADRVPDAP